MSLPIWFLLAAFLTEIMSAVVGFGSSTILTPITALVFDVKTALALVAIFHASGALVRLLRFRPAIDRQFLKDYGLPAIGATLFGALLGLTIGSQSLTLLLGFFLAGLVAFEWTHPRWQIPRERPFEAVGGLLTGFFAGLLGAGGAIRAASLQAFGMKKEEYIGTSALMALAVDLTRLPVYLAGGYLSDLSFWVISGLMALAVVGSFAGLALVDRLPQRVWRLIILGVVFFIAILLVREGFRG